MPSRLPRRSSSRRRAGTAHAVQRALGTEAAPAQPVGKAFVLVEGVDDNRTLTSRRHCRHQQRPRAVAILRHDRPDLIEQTALPAEAILRRRGGRSHDARVVRRARQRPFEYAAPVPTKDVAIVTGNRLDIRARHGLHVIETSGGAVVDRTTICGRGNMPRQHGLVDEAESLVERPPHRRRVQADRHSGRQCVHRGVEQTRPEPSTTVSRVDQHHGNPAKAPVVDANRRADDPFAAWVDGAKAARGRGGQEHLPIGTLLIPARRRAQTQRVVEIVERQMPDDRDLPFRHHATMASSKSAPSSSGPAGRGASCVTRCCGSVPSTSDGISDDE